VVVTGHYNWILQKPTKEFEWNEIKRKLKTVIQIENEKHHVHIAYIGTIFQPLCACQAFFYFKY